MPGFTWAAAWVGWRSSPGFACWSPLAPRGFVFHGRWPGVIIECRLVGVLRLEENAKKRRQRNDRLIAVPVADPKVADGCEDVGDLPERLRDEMEQFFLSTTFFTHKRATVRGWKGHKAAAKLVRRSQTV